MALGKVEGVDRFIGCNFVFELEQEAKCVFNRSGCWRLVAIDVGCDGVEVEFDPFMLFDNFPEARIVSLKCLINNRIEKIIVDVLKD